MATSLMSTTANSLLTMATGTGFLAAISANATEISLGLTCVGLIMAFAFKWISMKQADRLTDDWRRRESARLLKKLIEKQNKE